jgi:uncharacterized OB-fold protein
MSVARYWREVPQRYRFEAKKCSKCGYIAFPPRLVCPECSNRSFENYVLKDTGKILTYTIIEVGPTEFADQVPYCIGIVELDDGVKLTTQIVDSDLDKIKPGERVRLEFRKVQQDGKAGVIKYGYKAVVISSKV